MKQELQLQLINDFPILYGLKENESFGQTGRTTFSLYGFECDSGWYEIIYDLSAKLEKLNKQGNLIQVLQVKEKLGCLRFYCKTHPDELWDVVQNLINDAEERSAKTCEVCGESGKLTDVRKRGWIRALCDKHTEEHYK